MNRSTQTAEIDTPSTVAIDRSSSSRLLLVGSVLLIGFGVWRATLGVNMSDDAYSIVLIERMARGAPPLIGEQNLQVLGSLLAVPVAWLWLHLVGSTGLVLALRLLFVLFAGLVSLGCYRALRPDFPRAAAFAAATVPVLAVPYGLLVVSYNTVPMLATVLATCAGFAAVRRTSGPWAATSAAAAAVAVVGFPPILPAALATVVMVALLSRRREVLLPMLAAGGAVAVATCVWLLVAIGPHDLLAVVRLGQAIRANRATEGIPQALSVAHYYLDELTDRSYLPLGLLVLIAVLPKLPWLPRRLQVWAAVLIPFAAIWPAFRRLGPADAGMAFGVMPAVAGLLAGAVLVPVVLVLGRWDGSPVPTLMRIALPGAVIGVVLLAATTASGAFRGIPVIGIAGLLAASVAGWVAVIDRYSRPVSAVAAGTLVATLAVLLALTPFKQAYPWDLTRRVPSGVYAGIQTQPSTYAGLLNFERVGRRWVRPGEGYLVYGNPGAYLVFPGHPITNLAWLTDAIPENKATLRYFSRIHRQPDVIMLEASLIPKRGLTAMSRKDPLIAFTLAHYRTVDLNDNGLVVFRRI